MKVLEGIFLKDSLRIDRELLRETKERLKTATAGEIFRLSSRKKTLLEAIKRKEKLLKDEGFEVSDLDALNDCGEIAQN